MLHRTFGHSIQALNGSWQVWPDARRCRWWCRAKSTHQATWAVESLFSFRVEHRDMCSRHAAQFASDHGLPLPEVVAS